MDIEVYVKFLGVDFGSRPLIYTYIYTGYIMIYILCSYWLCVIVLTADS